MLLRKSSRPTDREGVGATDRSPSGLRDTPPWAHVVISSSDSCFATRSLWRAQHGRAQAHEGMTTAAVALDGLTVITPRVLRP